ncbi:MAG: glycosyltransferase family 4 protein [Pseudomonadota bacterium]
MNGTDHTSPPAPAADGPVAYLTGQYPRASHTFILREVAALRRLGLDIRTCSVRREPPEELIGPEERAAQAETFHVLETAKRPFRLVSDHVAAFLRAPGAYLGALGLALRTGRPGASGIIKQLAYFLEAGVLARHLAQEGAVHLHNHFADSSANLAMITAHMARLPFSFTLHGPAELFDPEGWCLGEKVARARFTICISHYARSQAMLFSDRRHWPRLRIVHCGVEIARYKPTPPGPHRGFRLVFVGRLTAIKGVFVLLDAIAEADRAGLHLTLIGDGPDRAALEAHATALGIDVAFLGYRSQADVAAALTEADALVLPSLAEGVPVVLMEAMASARPVIATQVGGVAELVAPEAGLLVPAGDTDALAQAVAHLAGQPPEARQAMGAAGRAIVEQAFDVDRGAARLARLFRGAPVHGPRIEPDAQP